MDVIFLIAGIIAGGAAGWFFAVAVLKTRMVDRGDLEISNNKLHEIQNTLGAEISRQEARLESAGQIAESQKTEIERLRQEVQARTHDFNEAHKKLAELSALNNSLQDKLNTQKKEVENLNDKFTKEFELIASKILEDKSVRFTSQNRENLENILKPLGENIESFRRKVEEVYTMEAKERFSLGKEVEKLMQLNRQVSEEAHNLTQALKGSVKIQGDWGEMVLKNILEQSGLEEGREYFLQETLKDEEGKVQLGDQGKRMRPDVIIQYPDDRQVVVDSKVSLVAYTRFVEADDADGQQKALREHMTAIKKHIDDLSSKSYQDYVSSLDFVMMFIPVEPAYLLALKEDSALWSYAYQKKILLISPTHLIAALKMLEDLWKREYQNRNAQAIAKRGGALYDKFVNFIESLNGVGKHLESARKSYDSAYGQLKSGRGSLVDQAEMLREMGVQNKKSLSSGLVDQARLQEGEED